MKQWKVAIVLLVATGMACASAPQGPMLPQDPKSSREDPLYALLRTDRKAFAEEVSKSSSSELGRAKAIVLWLTQHFDWKATDYKRRTVEEIIDRRGGNCDDLAAVALESMKELHLQLRRVHDVHIRTLSAERGEHAHALVKEKGDEYSVFGRHHNDHVWLEVYDSAAREWYPVDPWSGLAGLDEWMKARVWFGERHSLAPDASEMIVPIGIFAADDAKNFTIDRTKHYLVDEFDRLYGGKLHDLPAWKPWVGLLDQLDAKVQGAFAGTTNLHDYEAQIDSLAATYEELRSEARGLTPDAPDAAGTLTARQLSSIADRLPRSEIAGFEGRKSLLVGACLPTLFAAPVDRSERRLRLASSARRGGRERQGTRAETGLSPFSVQPRPCSDVGTQPVLASAGATKRRANVFARAVLAGSARSGHGPRRPMKFPIGRRRRSGALTSAPMRIGCR